LIVLSSFHAYPCPEMTPVSMSDDDPCGPTSHTCRRSLSEISCNRPVQTHMSHPQTNPLPVRNAQTRRRRLIERSSAYALKPNSRIQDLARVWPLMPTQIHLSQCQCLLCPKTEGREPKLSRF